MKEEKKHTTYGNVRKQKSFIREMLDVLLVILVFCIKASVLILILPIIIGTIICLFLWTWGICGGLETLYQLDIIDHELIGIMNLQPSIQWQVGLLLLFAIIFWGNLLYIVIRSFFYTNDMSQMSSRTRKMLIWSTVLSGILAITLTISASILHDKAEDVYEVQANTIDGVYLKKGHRERLARSGWTVSTYENCNANGRIYHTYSSLTDFDERDWCLDFNQDKGGQPMRIHLKQSGYYPEGMYRMEAIASAKGPGAYVYAQSENDSVKFAAIPVDDANNYGNMKYFYKKNDDDKSLKSDYADNPTISRLLPEIAEYWSYVQTAPFYHKGGLITTGITNMGNIVHQKELNNSLPKFTLHSIHIVPCDNTAPVKAKRKGKNKNKEA